MHVCVEVITVIRSLNLRLFLPQQEHKCVPLEQVTLQANSYIEMTLPSSCLVDDADACLEGEPQVHALLKEVALWL